MARRRVPIVRVRLAAWAVVAAACLGLPLALTLLQEGEGRVGPTYVVRDPVMALAGEHAAEAVQFEPPSADSTETIAELREVGDVDGLLAAVERARAERAAADASLGGSEPDSSALEPAVRTPGLRDPTGPSGDPQARRRQTARSQAAARRGILAIASLSRVPGPKAEEALRTIAISSTAPSLERTTALAALWERGVRDFVDEQGRDSDDPAVRSKVRALKKARP